jgi:Toprim domain/CHC2 zinc finger/DNA polymerase family A
MPKCYWDLETFSQITLKEYGAHIYARHPSTDIFFFCFAIDDGEVQVWRRGDPVAEPFANPAGYTFISDNWEFERPIHEHILVPRYGFPPLPIENQDCAQRLALANAYPAELGLRAEALGLPYRKDPEARKAMLRLSRPQTAKKRKKKTDDAPDEARERDLQLLLERCKLDVATTRACYNAPQLRRLLPEERQLLLLDAKINARGVCANVPFLEAVRTLAVQERNAINVRLDELTRGVITSVDQVKRILEAVNKHGHAMTSANKRSVAAVLAHQPDGFVRELLELRQRGAFASVKKAKKLLSFADPDDHRIRGALRIYGAGPGRWSSIGAQLHNLRRNDAEHPSCLVDALIAGDHAELARFGNPLNVVSELSRAALYARSGHVLVCADFGAIESRKLAWLAGEQWKLDAYRQYDATGDKQLEPYRVIAAQMLHKDVYAIASAERQLGKAAELAAGFGGSVGAWRRINPADPRTDAEITAIIRQWRDAHPAVRQLWAELARAARIAIRTGQPILVAPAPRPPIIAAFAHDTLTLTLPSGRAISYPQARLVPNAKFEGGDPDVEFSDNAQGQWKRTRAWFGLLVENVVQGTARDLLRDAIVRFETRGWPVVFHCHDEIVIEVPQGSVSEREVLALLLEPPAWAAGLPLGGKVHSGALYLEAPETAEPPPPQTDAEIVERAVDAFVADATRLPDTKAVERGAEETLLASLGQTLAPLTDLVSLPMNTSRHVSCPFHEDPTPSCKIYPDHYHCFGGGARGDRLDWLMRVEGMTRDEAMAALYDWGGPTTMEQKQSVEEKLGFVLGIWDGALPLRGTIGERYLSETRGIDVSKLSPTIHDALRFHPNCVFGAGARHPCIIALMRDPVTDAPVGIHRIGLAQENGAITKIDRKALGRMGVVKLSQPTGEHLVVGEGIETVLAAATRISYRGALLTPAWSAVAKGGLGKLPVLPGVQRLVLLVDNDANGEGQKAAESCRQIWRAAGRAVAPLVPKQAGWDFNDVVLRRRA